MHSPTKYSLHKVCHLSFLPVETLVRKFVECLSRRSFFSPPPSSAPAARNRAAVVTGEWGGEGRLFPHGGGKPDRSIVLAVDPPTTTTTTTLDDGSRRRGKGKGDAKMGGGEKRENWPHRKNAAEVRGGWVCLTPDACQDNPWVLFLGEYIGEMERREKKLQFAPLFPNGFLKIFFVESSMIILGIHSDTTKRKKVMLSFTLSHASTHAPKVCLLFHPREKHPATKTLSFFRSLEALSTDDTQNSQARWPWDWDSFRRFVRRGRAASLTRDTKVSAIPFPASSFPRGMRVGAWEERFKHACGLSLPSISIRNPSSPISISMREFFLLTHSKSSHHEKFKPILSSFRTFSSQRHVWGCDARSGFGWRRAAPMGSWS